MTLGSFPLNDDRAGLRAMLDAAVDGDHMGANARWERGSMWFDYRAAVLVGRRLGQA